MRRTEMMNEICGQPEVFRKIIGEYLPRAEELRTALAGRKKLFLVGTGASLHACRMARYMFYRYAPVMPVVLPAEELAYASGCIGPDDLVIFVSQSGDSYETKVYSSALKRAGTEIWGITNNEQSALAANSSAVFPLLCDREVSSATKTNTATALLLFVMAAGYDSGCAEELRSLDSLAQEVIRKSDEEMPGWAARLTGAAQMYILGTGVNEATAEEAALIVREKTFIHAFGSSVSDFRHGSVEVVEKGLPVILLAAGETESRKLKVHADYLRRLGADVFIVTNCGYLFDDFADVFEIVGTGTEEVSPVIQIIPLQVLAEKIASRKGLNVDGFRYLSKVVADYGH